MKPLSTETVLALHALHLMMIKTKPVSIKEVRQSSGFAADRIHSVLEKLSEAGLVRKPAGGRYALAKAPGEITIKELTDVLSEPETPTGPCGGDYEACDSRAACILSPLCRQAGEGYQETLRSFTLAELMGIPPDLPNCLDPKVKAAP